MSRMSRMSPSHGAFVSPVRRAPRIAAIAALAAPVFVVAALPGCGRAPSPPATEARPALAEIARRQNAEGVGLIGQFEFEQAQERFAEALRTVDPRSPEGRDIRVNKAIAILNQSVEGRQEEAIAMLEEILDEDPDHLRARYAKALCLLFLGRPEEARPNFAAVAAADRDDAFAAYYHGQCLELEGRDAEALAEYERASALDPYSRSPLLGKQRTLQKLGRRDEAAAALDLFQALADNPRARLVEFKYTRMGRKGEAIAVGEAPRAAPPSGPIFSPVLALAEPPEGWRWRVLPPGEGSATAADLDGDGRLDLFLVDALERVASDALPTERRHALLRARSDGGFDIELEHPLAQVRSETVPLWGDLDNDGLVDVVFCGPGGAEAWRQFPAGEWSRAWRWPAGPEDASAIGFTGGVLADLDHDGDLDLLLVAESGAPDVRLFMSVAAAPGAIEFREIVAAGDGADRAPDGGARSEASSGLLRESSIGPALAPGLGGATIPAGRGATQVVVGDFDGDRDLDIVILRPRGSSLLLNDRLWSWTPWEDAATNATLDSLVVAAAGDLDGDGVTEIVGRDRSGKGWAIGWRNGVGSGRFEVRGVAVDGEDAPGAADMKAERPALELVDLAGDGRLRAVDPRLLAGAEGLGALHPGEELAAWCFAELDARRGASLVLLTTGPRALVAPPGPGRFDFAALELRGRLDPGQSMRSNASGIGTLVNARVGPGWVTRSLLPHGSGRGQSLRPVAIGMGGEPRIDFILLDWSDGVFQSEVGVGPGWHRIVETQRQISSCPLIFVHDGDGYRFISDVLGVGGMGYLVEPGLYAPPRPDESFLLPEGVPVARDGAFELILHEPMEEAVYIDRVALTAWDLPPGWSMALDERMGLAEPYPTGEPIFFRREATVARATVEYVDPATARPVLIDATAALAEVDDVAAALAPIDLRFLGRLMAETTLTLHLAAPIAGEEWVLIGDGWVEYPYSQTNFAAWQAGVEYHAPIVEARGADGEWVVLLDRVGYPAGMPRRSAYPLPALPPQTAAIRLRSTLEIHWDRLALARREPCPSARATELPLRSAELRFSGYPRRTDGAHRRPIYDYAARAPFADMRTQRGLYTAFGPVEDLVAVADDATCIFGPGEEVVLRFDAAALPSAPGAAEESRGWTRRFVVALRGWCKDMDLFTLDGATVEPLPGSREPEAEALQRRGTTRFGGGR